MEEQRRELGSTKRGAKNSTEKSHRESARILPQMEIERSQI